MDALGHVNNTVYFRYMEQARVEWLERFDWLGEQRSQTTVVVKASCTFLIPIVYPGVVETRLYGGNPGRSSVETWYELRVQGDERLYAEGNAKLVWVDAGSGKSSPLPDRLRAALGDGVATIRGDTTC